MISRVLRTGKSLLGQVIAPAAAPKPRADSALGAVPVEGGVLFSVQAPLAERVELCLFDSAKPARETARIAMERDETGIWSVLAGGTGPGTLYGFRAHGPWKPAHGLWFNGKKLLLDPYAKAVQGNTGWRPAMQNVADDGTADPRDSADVMPRGVVIRDAFDWEGDAPPLTPWEDTVVYEMHVRGFTKLHPRIPEALRGTYAGLAHPEAVGALKDLGVTAVQLLPVHLHLDDGFLLNKGLTNYWGYNTLGFFAPQPTLAASRDPQAQVDEFKRMVRDLHRAGLEVILDVVYNHTCEGDERGPMLSLRGLDNGGCYLLNAQNRTLNYTGCGNTVNAASPAALRLIMDSLRYWVEEMHVDGFRFDLAATLGRRGEQFDGAAPFLQAVSQDPVLRRVKMIAEPWDIGPNGYQVGGFPKPWRELNGRYRDTVRKFWAGHDGVTASFSKRFCGSQDIFGPSGRPPLATLNMITSHDGFTLRDLWSYDHKHNEANGEENRDGDNANHGWNCGVEGETADPQINALRRRIVRSCLASMACSLGVPFITMGDERWRTQQGNNNGYCQDNAISWLDWTETRESTALLDFTRRLLRFRREHPELRRRTYFSGRLNPDTGRPDIAWLDFAGEPMTHEHWHLPGQRSFVAVVDAPRPLLLLFHSGAEDTTCVLPPGAWQLVMDTAREHPFPSRTLVPYTKVIPCSARSLLVLEKSGDGPD